MRGLVRRNGLAVAAAVVAVAAVAAMVWWPAEPPSGAPEIRALASERESVEYGRSYWLGQAVEGGLSWRMAVAFCRDPEVASLPNCRNVLDAERAVAVPAAPGIDPGETDEEVGR